MGKGRQNSTKLQRKEERFARKTSWVDDYVILPGHFHQDMFNEEKEQSAGLPNTKL